MKKAAVVVVCVVSLFGARDLFAQTPTPPAVSDPRLRARARRTRIGGMAADWSACRTRKVTSTSSRSVMPELRNLYKYEYWIRVDQAGRPVKQRR